MEHGIGVRTHIPVTDPLNHYRHNPTTRGAADFSSPIPDYFNSPVVTDAVAQGVVFKEVDGSGILRRVGPSASCTELFEPTQADYYDERPPKNHQWVKDDSDQNSSKGYRHGSEVYQTTHSGPSGTVRMDRRFYFFQLWKVDNSPPINCLNSIRLDFMAGFQRAMT